MGGPDKLDSVKPVRLEVIAPTLQGLGACTACDLVMDEAGVTATPALEEYPQAWQDDLQRLTDWVYDLADRYGDGIRIYVIDPQSPRGLFKSLRHLVRHYPTWVVDGHHKVVGWDRPALDATLEAAVSARKLQD
jgi:hypothetical protein